MDDATGFDFRGNWEIITLSGDKVLRSTATDNSDVRINLDTPTTPNGAVVAFWDVAPGTSGTYKVLFGGDGSSNGLNWQAGSEGPFVEFFRGEDMPGAFTRVGFNPSNLTTDVYFSELNVLDCSAFDPANVACDVVLFLGDSNASNAVSDFATAANTSDLPVDPRAWYMPCLRASSTNSGTNSERHIPQVVAEPVQASINAARISPVHAFTNAFGQYAYDRGKPLLILSLGDPGSGLRNTEDWVKGATGSTTAGRMYTEMESMLAAMAALGPAHTVVGAVVSLGANDTSGVDYSTAWVPAAQTFISNLRADTGVANLPIAWAGVQNNYELGAPDVDGSGNPVLDGDGNPIYGELTALPNRIDRMRDAQRSLADADANVVFVESPDNPLGTPVRDVNGRHSEVHFNATGMKTNGAALGTALKTLLEG